MRQNRFGVLAIVDMAAGAVPVNDPQTEDLAVRILRFILLLVTIPAALGLAVLLFIGAQLSQGFRGSSPWITLWALAPLAAGALFFAAVWRQGDKLLMQIAALAAVAFLVWRFAAEGTEAIREWPIGLVYLAALLAYLVYRFTNSYPHLQRGHQRLSSDG